VTCATRQLTGDAAMVWASEAKRLKTMGFPVNLNVVITKLKDAFGTGNRVLAIRAELDKLNHMSVGGIVKYCNRYQVLMAELGTDRTNLDYVQKFLLGLPRNIRMSCTQEFLHDPDAPITEYLKVARQLADPVLDNLFTKDGVSPAKGPTVQALGVANPDINKRNMRRRNYNDAPDRQPAPQYSDQAFEHAKAVVASRLGGRGRGGTKPR
jgi:hypothetical protein